MQIEWTVLYFPENWILYNREYHFILCGINEYEREY